MHHNVFYDSCYRYTYEPPFPEVLYRSRAPPLSCLHSRAVLARNRTFVTEQQKATGKSEIINSLGSFSIRAPIGTTYSSLPCLVSPCGFNHTEIELIGIGGQDTNNNEYNDDTTMSLFDLEETSTNNLQRNHQFNPMNQCFNDILEAEKHYSYPAYQQGCITNEILNDASQQFTKKRHDEETTTTKTTKPSPLHYNAASGSISSMEPMDLYQLLTKYPEHENGGSPALRKPFRLKRLAHCRPQSLGTDRITDLQVDSKISNRPLVYARNAHGLTVTQFDIEEWPEEDVYTTSTQSELFFPSVKPIVLTDMHLEDDSKINSLFINPHDYGVTGMVTAKRQLVVWDATISSPLHKVDLFRTTSRHVAQSEMHAQTFGNLAVDVLDCGCFTDHKDQILIGGSKLYMVDLRSRNVGFLFPAINTRSPHAYRYPKFTSRLPLADHFLAIAQHPDMPSLYSLVSGVTSSIYLWDIRNPQTLIDEIPLPLLKQGRGRYRSMLWSRIPKPMAPSHADNLYFLSTFNWNHQFVNVTVLSVLGTLDQAFLSKDNERQSELYHNSMRTRPLSSGTLDELNSYNENNRVANEEINFSTGCNSEQKYDHQFSNCSRSNQLTTNDIAPDQTHKADSNNSPVKNVNDIYHKIHKKNRGSSSHSSTTDLTSLVDIDDDDDDDDVLCIENTFKPHRERLTEFWNNVEKGIKNKNIYEQHPYFVNPFILFHSPSSFKLPVCEINGLCFSSSRPPPQIVVYEQIHLPLGIPSIYSEVQYYTSPGPPLSHHRIFYDDEFKTVPLSEAPLTQLFHGLAGIQILPLILPGSAHQMFMVVLGITFSGRIVALKLQGHTQKRKTMFNDNTTSNNVVRHMSPLAHCITNCFFNIPTSDRSQLKTDGPIPACTAFKEALETNLYKNPALHNNMSSSFTDTRLSYCCLPSMGWDQLLNVSKHDYESSFFSSNYKDVIYRYKLLGLHEILFCNSDNLNHYHTAIGTKMLEWRQRFTLSVLKNFPDLNPICFPEALLDLLMSCPPFLNNNKILSKDFEYKRGGRHIIPPLSLNNDTTNNNDDNRENILDVLIKANTALTGRELLYRCNSMDVLKNTLAQLEEAIMSRRISFWIASTGIMDCIHTELQSFPSTINLTTPYNNNNPFFDHRKTQLIWHPIGQRIGTLLCSCAAIKSSRPLIVPSVTSSDRKSWTLFGPVDQPFVFTSLARLLHNLKTQEHSKDSEMTKPINNDNTFLNFMPSNTWWNLATRMMVTQQNLPSVLMLESIQSMVSQHQNPIHPVCDLYPQENKFCCMLDALVFRNITLSRNNGNGTYDEGSNSKKLDPNNMLIQGRRFIDVLKESLNNALPSERHFIIENAPRDYPASYAFLIGVRITVDLYENLSKYWEPQSTNNRNLTNKIPDITFKKHQYFHPYYNEVQGTAQLNGLCILPRFASDAKKEKALLQAAQQQKTALSAISSRMTQRRSATYRLSQSSQQATPNASFLMQSVLEQARKQTTSNNNEPLTTHSVSKARMSLDFLLSNLSFGQPKSNLELDLRDNLEPRQTPRLPSVLRTPIPTLHSSSENNDNSSEGTSNTEDERSGNEIHSGRDSYQRRRENHNNNTESDDSNHEFEDTQEFKGY